MINQQLTEKAFKAYFAGNDTTKADIEAILQVAIEACVEIAETRISAMKQKVEVERSKEASLSVDYYQGRVNEGEVILSYIRRLLTDETAESLFRDALART